MFAPPLIRATNCNLSQNDGQQQRGAARFVSPQALLVLSALCLGAAIMAKPCLATPTPKAKTWKGTLPWSAPAWSPNSAALADTASLASSVLREAQLHSAAAKKKSVWELDVRAEIDDNGYLVSLLGTDLAWQASKDFSKAKSATFWAIDKVKPILSALGLQAPDDDLVPGTEQSLGIGKGWILRLKRTNQGVPVLGDEVAIRLNTNGAVVGLDARLTAFASCANLSDANLQSRMDDNAVGVAAANRAGVEPEVAYEVTSQAGVQTIAAFGGHVIGATRYPELNFAAFVTSRANDKTPLDHQCIEPNSGLCADTGVKAWVVDNGPPQCCKADPFALVNCNAGAPGPCYDAASPQVLAGRDAVVQLRSRLAAIGVAGTEQFPPNGNQPDLVVSPTSGSGGQVACAQLGIGNACAGAGLTCKGDIDSGFCAQAFLPTSNGNAIVCNGAFANSKAVILMANASFQRSDVLAHEFGHLWLAGHGIPPAGGSSVAAQAATLHESIADAFGLLVDDDDWMLGEQTACNGYRNACAPECLDAAEIAAFTADPACEQGPQPKLQVNPPAPAGTPLCSQGQPRLWRDYALHPPGGNLSGHFNSGISNFVWYLVGTTVANFVGGGPASGSGPIVGLGRPALGSAVIGWPTGFVAGALPTFDGLREVLIQNAAAAGAGALQTVERAMDAVGLWRTDTTGSSLFGVGRVASFMHSDGFGNQLAYAVNWDGVRRLNASRCVIGPAPCAGPSIRIENPAWGDADYPAGPPVAVNTAPNETILLYTNFAGQLIQQRVVSGAFDMPINTGVFPPWTLTAGLAIGAVRPTSTGPAPLDGTVLAYVCATAACTCNGLKAPGQRVICAQAFDGSWFQVLDTLDPLLEPCSQATPGNPAAPLPQPIVSAVAAPLHEPTLVYLSGSLVAVWVDLAHPGNFLQVHFAVASPAPANVWHWGLSQQWVSKGASDGSDLTARTPRPVAAAVLPGASGWSTIEADNADRIQIMFLPTNQPDLACAPEPRFYAFASARLGPDGESLVDFSRAVAQNSGKTTLLTSAPSYDSSTQIDHHAAGGFLATGLRTFAWVRAAPVPCPQIPLFPPTCQNSGPDYATAPVPGYGRLVVKSTGWR